MFKIDLLPARRGDCLWIEYGDPKAPRIVLIDGGVGSTEEALRARIEALPAPQRHLELLVISHFDLDHIAGILELLRRPPEGLTVGDVWFNGWQHLPPPPDEDDGLMGAKQAEGVAVRLEAGRYPWNRAFQGGAAALDPNAGEPPVKVLADGLRITLLSPTLHRLTRLRSEWEKQLGDLEAGSAGWELEGLEPPGHPEEVVEEDGMMGDETNIDDLVAEPFNKDDSRANGSSIAFLMEFEGKRCLFAGDAFASDLEEGVRRFAEGEGTDRLVVDALKLSHHGGHKNTSPELLALLDCPTFLFSTDGSYYKHPRPQTVARVIRSAADPLLAFNYRSDETELWDVDWLRDEEGYRTLYPPGRDQPGLSIEL